MLTKTFNTIFYFLLITCLTNYVYANNNTQELILKNGLKIIVKEDHRAPIVINQIWYKVGSSNETTGITGISHALEHMMFKGTLEHPDKYYTQLITNLGGKENAFSHHDYTAFYQILTNKELELCFKYEADRMLNLNLTERDFAAERNVVIEERLWRIEDNPVAVAKESFYSVAYPGSTYNQPILGWRTDIENISLDDISNWYNKWYTPNNATIVVAGDVNTKEVFALAKQYFSSIKNKTNITYIPPRKTIPMLGTRKINVNQPIKIPRILIGYNVPSSHTAKEEWHPCALEIIAFILDGGANSKFKKELIRGSNYATSASAHYYSFTLHSSLFEIIAIPSKKIPLEDLETKIIQQLDNLKTYRLSNAELNKIKLQILANKQYENDSLFNQACEIGKLESANYNWKFADEYLNKLQNVTAEQILQAAKEFFTTERQTIAYLIPQENNYLLNKTEKQGKNEKI